MNLRVFFYIYLFIYLFCCSLCVRVCSFLCSDSLVYTSFFSFLFYTVVYTRDCSCIDKSMQIVLEWGSIDKPLTFNIGLLQLIFHTSVCT